MSMRAIKMVLSAALMSAAAFAFADTYTSIDVPGATPTLIGDAGFTVSAVGEAHPLLAADGSAVFGASEGVGLYRPSGEHQRVTRCSGSFTPVVAGFVWTGTNEFVVACGEGRVELWGESGERP